jgi:hypothetical protein
MNKRLFFLGHDGWFEAEVSGRLLHASQEELVLWAYAMMERKNYRNYLITENPERMMTRRSVIASHSIQMPMSETG